MGGIKERWNRLCMGAGDLGAQDQGRQEPATLVELQGRLWPAASLLGIAEAFAALPDDDALIVDQLLPAYEEGRKSGRVDMDEVVRHIIAAGVEAYVGHSGGGYATIYAGKLDEWPDAHGDRRHAVLVGPGGFTAPDWKRPFGHRGDFCFGPDDDGDSKPVNIADGTPPEKVAELVVAAVRSAEARRTRLADAVEAAGEAFWAEIAKHYPEVNSGDFGPEETVTLERALHGAVSLWLHYNKPEEGIAEGRLAGASIALARKDAAAERVAAHITASGIRPEVLAELIEEVLKEGSDELAREHDYYPLGDQLVREELDVWVDDTAADVNRGGVDEQADTLVAYLGERIALARIDKAKADSEWWWNQHRNQIGDWCPHSGQLIPPAPDGEDDEDACPAGCPASEPSQDINDRSEDEQ